VNRSAKIVSGIAVGCVALYTIFGFWVIPSIVNRVIVNKLKATSPKVEVNCGLIVFNPFTFNTSASNLRISKFSCAGGEVDFSFKSLSIPVKKLAPFAHRIEIGTLLIEEPSFHMRKDFKHSASFNRKLKEQAKAAPKKTSPEGSWAWSIDTLKVTKGKASLTDTSLPKDGTLEAHAIEVSVHGLTSKPSKATFTASAVLLNGQYNASGDFMLAKPQAHIKSSASDVDLSKVNPWLRERADSELSLGKFSFQGTGSMSDGSVQANADAEFENISVKKNGVPFFAAKTIRATDLKLTKLDPLEFSIQNIKANLGLQDALLISDVQGVLGGLVGIFGENTVSKAIVKTKVDVISVSHINYKSGKLHTSGIGSKLIKLLNSIWTR